MVSRIYEEGIGVVSLDLGHIYSLCKFQACKFCITNNTYHAAHWSCRTYSSYVTEPLQHLTFISPFLHSPPLPRQPPFYSASVSLAILDEMRWYSVCLSVPSLFHLVQCPPG
jgi:hypothetical protein